MTTITVVPTGVANLASVRAAFARLGVSFLEAHRAADIVAAPALLLPGVGNFGPARRALAERGFDAALTQRLRAGRPTLGICLGMQLCCEGSDEAPDVAGLGVVPGRATRFPQGVRCPQMGWNAIVAPPGAALTTSGHAFFANSFRLQPQPQQQEQGWTCTIADHAGPFVTSLERGAVLLCQFHPELSGAFGDALLRRWLTRAAETVPC